MLYQELSYQVIGAAMDVHRTLGPGFLESVYEKALAQELTSRGVRYSRQVEIPVRYKNVEIGKFQADFIVGGKLLVELKAVTCILPVHEAQVLHYLTATGIRLALLLNFGEPSLRLKRIIK